MKLANEAIVDAAWAGTLTMACISPTHKYLETSTGCTKIAQVQAVEGQQTPELT